MILRDLGATRAPQHTVCSIKKNRQKLRCPEKLGAIGTILVERRWICTILQAREKPYQGRLDKAFNGGDGGIRTHEPVRANAFRVLWT